MPERGEALRHNWEEKGYVHIRKAVPLFYVLRFEAWRQAESQPLTGSLNHHQYIWDIRSMPRIYSAFADILNTPAIWAEFCSTEATDILGLLSVNTGGSSINIHDGEQNIALEASLADLIIMDQRRLRITGYTDTHWLPLGYIPAQENNHALIRQREQQYLEGHRAPAVLSELGQQLLGRHQWGTEKQ